MPHETRQSVSLSATLAFAPILAAGLFFAGGLVSTLQAHERSFHIIVLDGDGGRSVGPWCSHWWVYCGVEGAYLDLDDHRATVMRNECDIAGPQPIDDVDVDGSISYAGGRVAYMTAATAGQDLRSKRARGGPVEVVDTTGVVGVENSIAVDSAGVHAIAYQDFTARTLKFARRSEDATWEVDVVHSSGFSGYHPSLAIDPQGFAHISFVQRIVSAATDPGQDRVLYATETPAGWTFATARTFPGETIQHPTSLALHGSDAWIALGDSYTGALRLGHRTTGGAWTWAVVDSTEAGAHVSLRIDSRGFPHLAYFNEADGDLKYAHQDSSGWTIQTVDSAGVVGTYAYLDLAYDIPSISYFDATNQDVKIASDGLIGAVPPGTIRSEQRLTVHPSPLGRDGAVFELRGIESAATHATVHDIHGRVVSTVQFVSAGAASWSGRWNGTDATGAFVPAGVYFISIRTAQGMARGKVAVVR